MRKSWPKIAVGILILVTMVLLGLSSYIDKTVYKLQQTARIGSTEISGTQTAFFSHVIKNVTPFRLKLLGVSFQTLPEEIQHNGDLFVPSNLELGVPNAQKDVPVNFHRAEVPIIIPQNEEQYLGVYMENTGNASATAYTMILHCRIGFLNLDIITGKDCTITP